EIAELTRQGLRPTRQEGEIPAHTTGRRAVACTPFPSSPEREHAPARSRRLSARKCFRGSGVQYKGSPPSTRMSGRECRRRFRCSRKCSTLRRESSRQTKPEKFHAWNSSIAEKLDMPGPG